MNNRMVSNIFRDIARILEIKGENTFRIRAYERAAQAIENLGEDVGRVAREGRLTDIPGIGKDLAQKINEIVTTGSLKFYDDLKKQSPQALLNCFPFLQ